MSKSAPRAPAPPDPAVTAQAQTAANIETAIAQALLAQQQEVTPLGRVSFEQIGQSAVGGQLVPQFQRTVQLTPQAQAQFESEQQVGRQLSELALSNIGQVRQTQGQPFSFAGLPGLPSQVTGVPSGRDVEQAEFARARSLFEPAFEQRRTELQVQAAERGLPIGSEARTRLISPLEREQARATTEAAFGAVGAGRQEQGRLFQQALQNVQLQTGARQRGIEERAFARGLPFQEISSLLGGVPIQLPQFGAVGRASVAPADVIGATLGSAQLQQQQAAQQQQAQSAFRGGLLQLGGTLGAAFLSDAIVKQSIKRIGTLGPFGVYEFRYLGSDINTEGFLAQDVERILPEAVEEINGIKHVNYTMAFEAVREELRNG